MGFQKKSDDQTNIDKCRVDANIKEYYIISKLIFLKIIITKCMKKKQLFHVKINQSKKPKVVMLKMDILTFCNDYRVILLKRYLSV